MTDARTTPAARLDELTRLYERHAYVAWNVALRTTLDDDAAAVAARRAFAAQVTHPDEDRLALDTGRLAIDAAGGVDSRGVEHPVLAATVHLAAVQRAVLALAELTDVRPAEVAATLGIDTERERQLREGAYHQLGALLGVEGDGALAAYEDVPWAKPPPELWETLYPELHATVTDQARPETAPAATVSTRRRVARLRGSRRLRSGALAGVAALAVAGVAWAATGGSDSGSDSGTPGYGGLPTTGVESSDAESATSSLTPEELDRLRQEEIEQLKRLEQRKDNPSLPPQERDRAARKVNDLVKLARDRQQAAEERELALRRQLAREREARVRERNDRDKQRDQEPAPADEPQPTKDQPDGDTQPTGGQKNGGGGGDDRDSVETECLYDPDTGTYICPE